MMLPGLKEISVLITKYLIQQLLHSERFYSKYFPDPNVIWSVLKHCPKTTLSLIQRYLWFLHINVYLLAIHSTYQRGGVGLQVINGHFRAFRWFLFDKNMVISNCGVVINLTKSLWPHYDLTCDLLCLRQNEKWRKMRRNT